MKQFDGKYYYQASDIVREVGLRLPNNVYNWIARGQIPGPTTPIGYKMYYDEATYKKAVKLAKERNAKTIEWHHRALENKGTK